MRKLILVGVVVAALIGLVVVAPFALAQVQGAATRSLLAHAGPRGGHGMLLADPERAREHAAFATEWVLRGVNATPEQLKSARQRAERLVDELRPLVERHCGNREQLIKALSGPNVDRQGLEQLREAEMNLAQDASKIAVDAVGDLGELLTPEQRTELLEFVQRAHDLHQR